MFNDNIRPGIHSYCIAKSMGLSRWMLRTGIDHTTSGAASTDGAGAVGVTTVARVAPRSSRSCFNTSLVTMATMSAVLHAASGTPSGGAGKSSGRPASAAAGEWVVLARAAQPRRRASWLLGVGTAVSPWLVPVLVDVRVAAYCKC